MALRRKISPNPQRATASRSHFPQDDLLLGELVNSSTVRFQGQVSGGGAVPAKQLKANLRLVAPLCG